MERCPDCYHSLYRRRTCTRFRHLSGPFPFWSNLDTSISSRRPREVEDYTFFAGTTSGTVTGRIYHDMNGNSAKDSAEPYLPNISVTVTDAGNNPQSVVTDANGYWSALVPAGSATVDINNTDPDAPAGTVLPAGADPRNVTIVSRQNIDGGTVGFGPAGYALWQSNNNTSGAMNLDHDHDGVSNGIEYFLVGPQVNSTGFNTLPGI
jgi:hypothetical protein